MNLQTASSSTLILKSVQAVFTANLPAFPARCSYKTTLGSQTCQASPVFSQAVKCLLQHAESPSWSKKSDWGLSRRNSSPLLMGADPAPAAHPFHPSSAYHHAVLCWANSDSYIRPRAVWKILGTSVWTWGRTSSLWGWRSTGTGCPGRLWSLLLRRCSRPSWTRSCAACCRWPCFGRGVGLDDPQRSLPTLNILWFCDILLGYYASILEKYCFATFIPPHCVLPRITNIDLATLKLYCWHSAKEEHWQ